MLKQLILSLILTATVLAQPAGNVTRPTTLFDYRKELGLTGQQIKDIKQILKDLLTTTEKQRARIEQLNTEYAQMVRNEAPLEQAHAKLVELEKARTEWRYTDLKASYRLLEVLTPEQRRKWRQMLQEHKQ